MENKLIDPYGLLGVDSRASLSELKKNYYNLALICHPDKGGNDKDMNVVSLAYNYIKEHLENVKETTYEKLEDEFADFCKGQESLKPPTTLDRYMKKLTIGLMNLIRNLKKV